jgi:hypothetical protein
VPNLTTTGPDTIIGVSRMNVTHTPTGERCVGGPFEQLVIMTYGANNLIIDIRKSAVERDGTPTCVPGLKLLRDELNKIIDEYTGVCPTCHRRTP